MKSGCKKPFSICIIFFILISLVYPSYQVVSDRETTDDILSCTSLLYLEGLCTEAHLGIPSDGVTRHILRSMRRQPLKVIPLGVQTNIENEVRVVKNSNDIIEGVVFMTILMMIVIYIFRSDGKKRVLANN